MVKSKQLSTNDKFHVFAGEIHLAATVFFRIGQTFKVLYVLPLALLTIHIFIHRFTIITDLLFVV